MDVNMMDLIESYGSEDKCRNYLEALKWPNGPRCLRCGSVNTPPIPQRDQYRCRDCQYHFSVTAGTTFQDSHLPITKWFLTTYMMIESKKSISANQINRTIDVSYKTAWYLCHRVREAMKDANPGRLSGVVEVDETYIGGKRKGIGARITVLTRRRCSVPSRAVDRSGSSSSSALTSKSCTVSSRM